MLPASPGIKTRSCWDGGRGGSSDSYSVGSVGHSVTSIARKAEVRGSVGPVTSVGIASEATVAQAISIGTIKGVSISISRDASSQTNLEKKY